MMLPTCDTLGIGINVTMGLLQSYFLMSFACVAVVSSFHANMLPKAKQRVFMVPKYNSETSQWTPSSSDEGPSAGYPAFGSLLRQGPSPFIQRILNPDDYEQGVLKMMANEGMSRNEAQGNMDAYIRNPNDWALQKVEESRGAPKLDYANVNMNSGDLALTAVWSTVLLSFISRTIYLYTIGCDSFCQEYHF
eukprot:scaffold22589_cov138-Cylindrotheca_fusiformis.AAC.59